MRYNYRLLKKDNILKILFFYFFFVRRDFIIFIFKNLKRVLNFNFKPDLTPLFDIDFRRNKKILSNVSFINFKISSLTSKGSLLILKISLRILTIVFFVEIIIIFNKFNYYIFDFFLSIIIKILNFSRFSDFFERMNKSVENNSRFRLKYFTINNFRRNIYKFKIKDFYDFLFFSFVF